MQTAQPEQHGTPPRQTDALFLVGIDALTHASKHRETPLHLRKMFGSTDVSLEEAYELADKGFAGRLWCSVETAE